MLKLNFFIFIFLFLIISCQNTPPVQTPKTGDIGKTELGVADSLAVKDTIYLYMATNFPSIKLRQTPDLQGAVSEIINQIGTVLIFQNDSTEFETETKINQQLVKSRWYKVANPQTGKTGWIFGIMASFVPKDENQHLNCQRKITISNNSEGNQAVKIRDTRIDNNLLNSYKNQLKNFNYKQYFHISQAAIFFENNFANASAATCDRALLEFNGFYQQAVNFAKSKQNASKYQGLATEIRTYGRAYAGADSSLFYLSENGIKLIYREGKVEFGEDWDFVARRFYRFVSPAMRDYLNQIQLEAETYWQEKGQIVVALTQIADWASFWANFTAENPNFLLSVDCQQRSQSWLKLLVYGLDNQPVFDSNKKLHEVYKLAYEYLNEGIKTEKIWGEFAQRFGDFYATLAKNDFTFNNNILKAQQILLKETD